MTPLGLLGKLIRSELCNKVGELLRYFLRMGRAMSRIFPFNARESRAAHPVLRELAPHVRHVGREVNVASVFAPVDVGARAAVVLSSRTSLQPIIPRVAGHG